MTTNEWKQYELVGAVSGLLGTVVGMIHSFIVVYHAQTQPQFADLMAIGLPSALCTTFLTLCAGSMILYLWRLLKL